MRSVFSQADNGAPPAAPSTVSASGTGWNALSGKAKIALVGGAVAAIFAVVVVPGLGPHKHAVPAQQVEAHPPASINAYAPPMAQNVVSRVTGAPRQDTTAAPLVRQVPAPTEMALYTAPSSTIAEAGNQASGNTVSAGGAQQAGAVGGDQTNGLTSELSGTTQLATSHATLVRNSSFLIRAGAVIPCLPIDAQNSSRPGFTSCRVPEWFRSSDQSRGLIPPGTRIFGQIRSGISQGQRRLGVVYTLIEAPRFNMTLAAPGADSMGRAGLDGDIHTFFWDKAGAVALYALMDVAVGTGQNLASSALSRAFNGGYGQTLNFGSQGQSLASQEFQTTMNRPPILTRDQALPMTVTVGQDLDFTAACKLALSVDPMACPLL